MPLKPQRRTEPVLVRELHRASGGPGRPVEWEETGWLSMLFQHAFRAMMVQVDALSLPCDYHLAKRLAIVRVTRVDEAGRIRGGSGLKQADLGMVRAIESYHELPILLIVQWALAPSYKGPNEESGRNITICGLLQPCTSPLILMSGLSTG